MNKLQRSQILDIQEIKLPRNLKFTDRLSMSNGIETRLPILDADIAKYCFNLKNDVQIINKKELITIKPFKLENDVPF